ncbi:NAD-dependent epimerase/dehydratase family protein [Propionibacteriaceae bacterium Y2011]
MPDLTSVDALNNAMATVSSALAADLGRLSGDILVVGAAGKLGPSLVNLACRGVEQAGTGATVYAASRFGSPGSAEEMESFGATVVPSDVSTDEGLAKLPDVENVIFLVGAKFGTDGNEHDTWATNAYLPGRVAERFAGSRIAALSTGNVYPFVPVDSGGCVETDFPGPVGDYAMSCLGRERVMTHFSHKDNTPLSIIRLNYAVETRYGVLVDIATKIKSGVDIDISMGYANIIWQGYCNEVIIRSLLHADVPPFLLNLTGMETISIAATAKKIASAMGREAKLVGTEAPNALLSNASKCHELFGQPTVGTEELITATADWVEQGLPLLDKPTHFQTRDGKF